MESAPDTSQETERFDVAVVGGGPAGIAAALAAAGLGARTLLVERHELLGGNVSNALVHSVCGLYLPPGEAGTAPVFANDGLPRRIAEALQKAGAASAPERDAHGWVLPTDPVLVARVAAERCEKTKGLTPWMACEVDSVRLARTPEEWSELHLRRILDTLVVQARVVLDASGDGVAGARGGADRMMAAPDALQCAGYSFKLQGVENTALQGAGRQALGRALAQAARESWLPPDCGAVQVHSAPRADEAYVTLQVPKLPNRPFAPLATGYLESLQALAHRAATEITRLLRETQPAFKHSRLVRWPRRIGIRETRRLCGEVILTREDVLAGRRRDDEVALSTWPIELWNVPDHADVELPRGPCSVPLGALVSRSHPMLGMAGRCLSATHEALGALGVIGTALATGEALGSAAALAADRGVSLREIRADEVRECVKVAEVNT